MLQCEVVAFDYSMNEEYWELSVMILHKLAFISVSRDLLLCNQTSWSFARRH